MNELVKAGAVLPVANLDELSSLGEAVAKSGMFGTISKSTGAMIAMTMLQEGISPVTFKKKYHIMGDGNLAVSSRAIVSAFKRLGGKMELHEVSKAKCDITFRYDGNEMRYCVTLQEFIDNGVAVSSKTGELKDNWRKFPMDMLYARCTACAIRKICPESDDGLYTTEEVSDFDAKGPKEIAPEDIKVRAARVKKPAAPTEEPEMVTEEPEVVEPVVMPSAKEIPQDAASMICPVAGDWYGKTFGEIAETNPDIIHALLTCNRNKHPELTNAHLSALEQILATINGVN